MKKVKALSFIVFFALVLQVIVASAQQTSFIITATSFNEEGYTQLSNSPLWEFKKGTESSLEKANLETTGWEQMNLQQLSREQVDGAGKIEGWFRIKLKMDSSLAGKPLFIYFNNIGAAVDMYVDGELFYSFGNTGINNTPYERMKVSKPKFYIPFEYKTDTTHLLSFCYRYKPASFPANLFPLHAPFKFIVGIAGSTFQEINESQDATYLYLNIFRATVCLILTFLFVLLLIQNPGEKILKLIVLSSFFYCVSIGFSILNSAIFDVPYAAFILLSVGTNFTFTFLILSIILIFSHVFTGRNPKRLWLHVLLIISLACQVTLIFIPIVIGIHLLIVIGICIHYILISWKRVEGAQWAIIAGFIVTLLAMLGFALSLMNTDWTKDNLYWNFIILSFPISLLVYVSMRFKEVIGEVRMHAAQLVKITEEKRQHALNQQVVLEAQVKERTAELSQSLENLKATQSQLIQSEKMASLGELTAGIAHEIQNPLNFVNNFSEVSNELLDEMTEELNKGEIEEAKLIANDVKQNLGKILHHGKRADGIVKGMLQHSRSSSGTKEPTDINALADEYLRLAYHGLRAKDKSFNAKFETHFDESIEKVEMVPQDIGRVILNLITNAFYVVNERLRQAQPDSGYEPTVIVSTKKIENKIQISVKDNGNGIPDAIKEKIFQPFFTTKPTGQGTGLGLSLSYDIVKAHGGSLEVESKENVGSEFVIKL